MRLKHAYFLTMLLLLALPFQSIAKDDNNEQTLSDSLLKEANQFFMIDSLDLAISTANKVLEISRIKPNINLHAGASFLLGQIYTQMGQSDSSIHYFSKADTLFSRLQDTLKLGETNVRIGYIYRRQEMNEKAMFYYQNALNFITPINSPFWFGFTNDHLGHIYLGKGNYYLALQHLQDARHLTKNMC